MDVFSTLFALVERTLDTFIHEAVINAVNYVDGPLRILATLTVIFIGLALL